MEDELKSLTVWGVNLLCSLVVWQRALICYRGVFIRQKLVMMCKKRGAVLTFIRKLWIAFGPKLTAYRIFFNPLLTLFCIHLSLPLHHLWGSVYWKWYISIKVWSWTRRDAAGRRFSSNTSRHTHTHTHTFTQTLAFKDRHTQPKAKSIPGDKLSETL